MKIYATKKFVRFARKAVLANTTLIEAVFDIRQGRFDADLGRGIFKQRIARESAGKSGGYRTIVLFRSGKHSFFIHGFAKNDKANISAKELIALQKLADFLFSLAETQIPSAVIDGDLVEIVRYVDEDQEV